MKKLLLASLLTLGLGAGAVYAESGAHDMSKMKDGMKCSAGKMDKNKADMKKEMHSEKDKAHDHASDKKKEMTGAMKCGADHMKKNAGKCGGH